jgi:hypothetical protein
MRNFLLSIVIFSFSIISSNAQDVSALYKDKNFINYVNNEIKFTERGQYSERFTEITADSKIDEKELAVFYDLLQTNEKEYKDFITSQNEYLKSFYSDYKLDRYSDNELIGIISVEFNQVLGKRDSNDCLKKFWFDIAGNYGAAVVGHAGCAALDSTVVAAWVGIACHAGVTTMLIAANNNAEIEYSRCMKQR